MKKDVPGTIKRAERFQIILIGEGMLVGVAAGIIVLLYRIALEYAGTWLNTLLAICEQTPARMAGWFAALFLLALIVAQLVAYEPMISGSGIPQLKGEMTGKFDQSWLKVLWTKFVGGFLCLLGGLALGREGPSIQLGAMVGKGISTGLDRGKTEEKFLLTCGASAGLAAAFHAPLAGVMFSLEEIHKNFSVSVLLSVMTASLTADFLCTVLLGVDAVFQFGDIYDLPAKYYGWIILLGVLLGVLGAFYNWFTLKVQELYRKIHVGGKCTTETIRITIPFLCAGILGFTAPELLGSGHSLLENLAAGDLALGAILFILIGRFVFSGICFGSGAPGGIFFPLLVLGGFIGGAFAAVGVTYFGLEAIYVNNFVILAMAGYFAAIVRAPITGIILIFEMTGSFSHMLSISIISIVAYIVATLMKSQPIYESLLDRLLQRQQPEGDVQEEDGGSREIAGQKILTNFVIKHGSAPDGKTIGEVTWPDNCLLVAVQRGTAEIIPKGKTQLQPGDVIVTLTDERDAAIVHEKMERLCKEQMEHFS